MNSNHVEVEELASLALLLVSDGETAAIREHLAGCKTCSAEYEQIRADLGVYAFSVDPVQVPAGSRERFLAAMGEAGLPEQLPRAQQRAVVTPGNVERPVAGPEIVRTEVKRTSSSASRILPWIGWAAAAAAVVIAVGLKQDRNALRNALQQSEGHSAQLEAEVKASNHILGTLTDPKAVRVSLTAPKALQLPSARATYEPKSGTLLMLASNLAPLPERKVYELWVIPANGGAPLPAGTFFPDMHGNASLLVPSVHGAVAAKALGITIEPAGGSATPTMPIVLAGTPS
jgi:hypothetical protein